MARAGAWLGPCPTPDLGAGGQGRGPGMPGFNSGTLVSDAEQPLAGPGPPPAAQIPKPY
jgi:hypothetical protein